MSCRIDGAKPTAEEDGIKQAIRSKYAEVSISASGKFQYPVGKDGVRQLGYDPAIIESAPERFFASTCPVGNPFSLGAIASGSAVLDFGCGAGFDMYVASRLVGEKGRVCGIDLTEAMARRAQENLVFAGVRNFEVKAVDSDTIPYADGAFDVVVSNGAINLSPCKQTVFGEIYRVLKNGGSLRFADVVVENALPAGLAGSAESWSQ